MLPPRSPTARDRGHPQRDENSIEIGATRHLPQWPGMGGPTGDSNSTLLREAKSTAFAVTVRAPLFPFLGIVMALAEA
jgi:hypothetical protein